MESKKCLLPIRDNKEAGFRVIVAEKNAILLLETLEDVVDPLDPALGLTLDPRQDGLVVDLRCLGDHLAFLPRILGDMLIDIIIKVRAIG